MLYNPFTNLTKALGEQIVLMGYMQINVEEVSSGLITTNMLQNKYYRAKSPVRRYCYLLQHFLQIKFIQMFMDQNEA